MINKQALHRIIDLAQRGQPLLAGEVAILREAVDLLDDLSMTLDQIMKGSANAIMRGQSLRFQPSDTQSFRVVDAHLLDDESPGRP